jgi:protein tyrosine phosphatase (PTP) superfamily phosphohydrolase (DUF442 family)
LLQGKLDVRRRVFERGNRDCRYTQSTLVNNSIGSLGSLTLVIALVGAAPAPQTERPLPNRFERSANVDVPVVLCIDDKPSAGGQPSGTAYAKAAANGYRSVLTLRTKQDGVDLVRERLMVEQNKMRYFNIPAGAKLPRHGQVDEFLALVRDKANHPMLLNCAFAERVAPFMMIFRVTEQGWNEDKAVEEAIRTGLKHDQLKKFINDYLIRLKKKQA